MAGFVEGADRAQSTLLPECLDDWIGESKPIIEAGAVQRNKFSDPLIPNRLSRLFPTPGGQIALSPQADVAGTARSAGFLVADCLYPVSARID
jgi:hypothetical protein